MRMGRVRTRFRRAAPSRAEVALVRKGEWQSEVMKERIRTLNQLLLRPRHRPQLLNQLLPLLRHRPQLLNQLRLQLRRHRHKAQREGFWPVLQFGSEQGKMMSIFRPLEVQALQEE